MNLKGGSVVRPRRYMLVEKLGEGGMGVVWRARDATLRRDVAMKILPAESREIFQEFFEREALAMARVQSEHVIEIFDAGRMEGPNGAAYFVMELIDPPKSLWDVRAELRADLGLALRLFIQATEGLGAIHRRGMVHRDVKPSNLLVATRSEGGRRVLKVADFGIALFPDEFEVEQPAVGTFGYAAPEQLMLEAVDARADVYGLGATMYELLCGERPHTEEALSSWWHARHAPGAGAASLPPPPLARARNEGIPAALCAVIAQCLDPNVNRRFKSMGALRFALEHVLTDVVGVPLAERSDPSLLAPEDAARVALADLAEAVLADDVVVDSERTFLRRRALQLGVAEERADAIVSEVLSQAGRRGAADGTTEG
jgi:serine/threonine protein kinase